MKKANQMIPDFLLINSHSKVMIEINDADSVDVVYKHQLGPEDFRDLINDLVARKIETEADTKKIKVHLSHSTITIHKKA